MEKISWKCQCFGCRRPIHGGRPTILFSTKRPELVGLCHSGCSYGLYRYDFSGFQMCPPDYLSQEEVSFLMHFYPKLYSLPGGEEPNRELRWSVAVLLRDFPASLCDPMASLRNSLEEHTRSSQKWLYDGDLETDFLRLLGEIQRSAKEKPARIAMDFRLESRR